MRLLSLMRLGPVKLSYLCVKNNFYILYKFNSIFSVSAVMLLCNFVESAHSGHVTCMVIALNSCGRPREHLIQTKFLASFLVLPIWIRHFSVIPFHILVLLSCCFQLCIESLYCVTVLQSPVHLKEKSGLFQLPKTDFSLLYIIPVWFLFISVF